MTCHYWEYKLRGGCIEYLDLERTNNLSQSNDSKRLSTIELQLMQLKNLLDTTGLSRDDFAQG